jgi:ribose 5-phosphate isomerase A
MSTAAGSPSSLYSIAERALQRVAGGMVLGLGTGRAAEAFIERLAERSRAGLRVRGVPTSQRSDELARRLNIEVVSLEEIDRIDIAFDGADEVAPDLSLTKGLGGALLREKVVASEAEQFVVLVTAEKLVERLGTKAPIPIEVVQFAAPTVTRRLKKLGGKPTLRRKQGAPAQGPAVKGFPYLTDNQNWILDTDFGPIDRPGELDAEIRAIPGVVGTGLFVGMASAVIVGEEGSIRELRRTAAGVVE